MMPSWNNEDDELLTIERSIHSSRGRPATVIPTIVEEDVDDVVPPPPKRLSFAPDPKQLEDHPESSFLRSALLRRFTTPTPVSHRHAGSTTLHDDSLLQPTHHRREHPCIPKSYYQALYQISHGRLWRYTCYMFIFLMLFGSQIQELWLPKSADVACDVVFTMAIVFLSLDSVVQSILDPLYFSWNGCKHETKQTTCWFQPPFQVGSFAFWADVLGTLTFLYEIEYINPLLQQPAQRYVELSPMGIPISGLHRRPGLGRTVGNPYLHILLVVGRVARMGRFIRTTVIVQYVAMLDVRQYVFPRVCDSCGGCSRRRRMPVDTGGGRNSSATTLGSNSIRRASSTVHRDSQTSSDSPTVSKRKRMSQYTRDSSSHVGAAMRELTGQRIVIGVIIATLLTVLFTYKEDDGTPVMTMILLHGQTRNEQFATKALTIARTNVVPNLFRYQRYNESNVFLSETYVLASGRSPEDIRLREMLNITIHSDMANTNGVFDVGNYIKGNAMTELITTIFILIIWIIGVTAFAGPVMTLVVEPIERMIVLLSMLMKDPLGYQNSPQYKALMEEENAYHYHPNWGNKVLKGMETSFLMSTILRIGSLMQVGFGSAGTEIIRSGLERGRHKDVLFLNKQGSTVSCIFMFCDIRSFTDATECLQEEVFVFTNKIAAVIHSISHSYGGSANKNIGDAFLVSWILDERPPDDEDEWNSTECQSLYANNDQADKALLSVVKISIALYHDAHFVESMSEDKKSRLLTKFSDRPGPLVQMGFGLHAGKAVQGAIGSSRKLDATYISESVERAEFLESSTKKYGTQLLMSDAFFNLLSIENQYRCRKVDQLLLFTEDDSIYDIQDVRDRIESGDKMNMYTYDMDIAALWKQENEDDTSNASPINELFSTTTSKRLKRPSLLRSKSSKSFALRRSSSNMETMMENNALKSRELDLPTGVCDYDERCWLSPDIKAIRHAYVSNGIIFPMFESGLIAFYGSQWKHAKQCFERVLTQIDDGPSKYYLKIIEEHDGVPPPDFIGFGLEK